MAAHSIDVTTATFEAEVLERSRALPVLVDFWAPWCGPCRVLKPILEKLAVEFAGKFALAKVNTDENPEVAQRYGVRGIPNVKAFVAGEVADEFTGALPETGVRGFLARLIPSPAEERRRAALAASSAGDVSAAEAFLREALSIDPRLDAARVDLAELLVAKGDFTGAHAVLADVVDELSDDRARALRARVALGLKAASLASASVLKAAVEARPGDLDARLAYAERLAVDGALEPAMDHLVEVVRGDRGERRERARKALVDLFGLAADRPDLVGEYRRRLAAALY
jgi:putative thioredoxin